MGSGIGKSGVAAGLLVMLAACGDSTPLEAGLAGGGEVVAGDCGPHAAGAQRALFGDLHVHTRNSFDAYFFNSINGPEEALDFARGVPGGYPGGDDDPNTAVSFDQIDRPLDFVAITDHAEFLGAFNTLCELGGTVPAGTNPACEIIGGGIRGDIRAFVEGRTTPLQIIVQSLLSESPIDRSTWRQQQVLIDARNEPCRFTTLHGYEFSSNKRGQMLHRNIIFRGSGDEVPDVVFDSVSPLTGVIDNNVNDEWMLFDHLDEVCGGLAGCRAMTIPHSSNLSDGRFFLPRDIATGLPPGRDGVAMTAADAELRRRFDRVLEIYQHKGNSECAAGVEGPYLQGEETTCDFELSKNVCSGSVDDPPGCAQYCSGDPARDPAFCSLRFDPTNRVAVCETVGVDGASGPHSNCTAPLDYYRNAMAEGMAARGMLGVNPYRQGIIASSDTHNGTPGMVRESAFPGHGGVLDNDPDDQLGSWDCDHSNRALAPEDPADPERCTNRVFLDRARGFSPGGLAGVWAPENTRQAVWDALHRGESFGTSGPRMRIRMQVGWTPPPADICHRLAEGGQAVLPADGAVMGGDLPPPPDGATAPYVTLWAMQDPGGAQAGLPLQALDIVKGFVDGQGEPRVRAYEAVVRTPHAVLPPAPDCSVLPAQHPAQLCVTWQDPDFDPARDAYWYARAREIPSCRWSTQRCVSAGVDCAALQASNGLFAETGPWAGHEGCCLIEGGPGSFTGRNIFAAIEERAWASPVWYEP